MRHDDPEIRAIALAQVLELTGLDPEALLHGAEVESDLAMNPPMDAELLFAALMNWHERNAAKLRWDDATGRYIVVEGE